MNNNIYIDIAKICSLSYLSKDNILNKMETCGPYKETDCDNVLYKCSKIPLLLSSHNDCQILICKYENYLSLCFRGTESKEDILVDLNIIKVPFNLDIIDEENIPYVHKGFYNQFNSLKDDINKEIKKHLDNNENIKLIFSGHSLGGAIATIASLHFKYKYPNQDISCITFGSPRVGCINFANLFNNKINNSVRFVNDNDPVPCFPTPWRFKHVVGLNWINKDKIENEISVWRFYRFFKNTIINLFGYGYNAINDHSCMGYFKDLQLLNDL